MSGPLDGLLLVDKPAGPTSHDVVVAIRRALGGVKVGHAGTLDPPATGLLALVLGTATRLVGYLDDAPKVYTGKLLLGLVTSTDDDTGEIVRRHDGPLPLCEEVIAAASRFRGRLEQRPPSVSARKVGGHRLYELARRGVAVEARAAAVEVFRWEIAPEAAERGEYRFEVEVSTGTYIRSLARDLGEVLGCGGSIRGLRRTRAGALDVGGAIAFHRDDPPGADAIRRALLPLRAVPLRAPALRLDASVDAIRFASGNAVDWGSAIAEPLVAVLGPGGELLGLGEPRGGAIWPRVVLPRA